MKRSSVLALGSSFRDRSGFVFKHNGEIFRRINKSYKADYEFLQASGLYEELCQEGMLVMHEEQADIGACDIEEEEDCFKVIKPVQIPIISYPYEWCFSQLKMQLCLPLKLRSVA